MSLLLSAVLFASVITPVSTEETTVVATEETEVDSSVETSLKMPDEEVFDFLETEEEKEFAEATLEDDFHGDSLIVTLTRAASKDNRDWTAEDFKEVGAIGVEDIDRLSEKESVYAENLWDAEDSIVESLNDSESVQEEEIWAYEEAKEQAEENTLVNF